MRSTVRRDSALWGGLLAPVIVVTTGVLCACGGLPSDSSWSSTGSALFANDQAAYEFFINKGLTCEQSAGIVGNLDQESGVDPTALQYGGGPGRGIAQWSAGGRWDTTPNDNAVWYAGQMGENVWSLQLQLEFIWYELPSYGFSNLQAATTVDAATVAFEEDFEICCPSACNTSGRESYAQGVLSAVGCTPPVPPIAQVSGNEAITAVNWPDQHSELFVKAPNGTELHSWSDAAGDAWATPAKLDVNAECGSAAAFWGPPWSYPELFSPLSSASTGHLWWASGAWNTYQPFGGSKLAHASTVVWPDGHTEVFALGSDRAIWHNYWDTGTSNWSGWSSMGGTLDTGVSPIVWGNGTVEMFATDASGGAWHMWFSGGKWSAWTNVGSGMASRPAPVRWADGHVEVFIRGQDNHLYHSNFNSTTGWPAFSVLSASDTIVGDPSAIMNVTTAEVFARSETGQVEHVWGDGTTYNNFVALGSLAAASDPFAWSRGKGEAEVFAVDTSGALQYTHRTSSWSTWAAIGTNLDPCAPALPSPDAGTPKEDAGAPAEDAGESGEDAGHTEDAGHASDAGTIEPTSDAGSIETSPDAGITLLSSSGCGCTGGPGGAPAPWPWLVVLLVAARWRKSGVETPRETQR
jgi:MYXO-CTERM domain-containing protein